MRASTTVFVQLLLAVRVRPDLIRLAALAAVSVVCACATTSSQPSDLVIADVTVISGERPAPLEHAYVRIVDGRIAEVSARRLAGEEEIDGSGRFLIPGLIDSHVHLSVPAGMMFDQTLALPEIAAIARAQEPRSYLYFGFTTIVDLFGAADRITEWNAQEVRPDAYYCPGVPIANGFPTAGVPVAFRFTVPAYQYFLYDLRQADQIPDSVDPAEHTPEAVVARIAPTDAVCVKTHFEPGNAVAGRGLPTPTVEMMRAVVAAAHEHGLPVIMHANTREAQAFAVQVAPDMITHTIPDAVGLNRETLDEEVRTILDGALAEGVTFQPTLQPFYSTLAMFDPAYFDDPRVADAAPAALIAWFQTEEGGRWRRQLVANSEGREPVIPTVATLRSYDRVIGYLIEHDARFVFGSDTPATASYGNLAGLSGRLEMDRLAGAGMGEAQLFRALTIDNAEAFGLDAEFGTVEEGKVANLLLLGANPLTSVEAYDTIETVFLRGRPIARQTLSARNAHQPL